MAEPVLEQRVDRLEDLMADLVQVTAQTQFEMRQHRDASARDMGAFKEEMRLDREATAFGMATLREELRLDREAFQRNMATLRKELRLDREASARNMAAFTAKSDRDMAAYNARSDRDMAAFRQEMRKSWGELSQKMGTMAEDLVAPSVSRILRAVADCPEDRIDSIAVRVQRRSQSHPGRSQEFDVVATCGEHALINETKSRLVPSDVTRFVARLQNAREFFPDLAGKRIIGVIASLYVDQSLVRHAEKHGLIVLGFGQDVMDVLNTPGFKPREF